MAKRHGTEVDGLTAVRAAVRSGGQARRPARKVRTPASGPPRPVAAGKRGPKLSRTVLPSRHEIVCYHCGYGFPVTGRLATVHCARCRRQLETRDVSIAETWSEDILTTGRVVVEPTGVVRKGRLVAGDIVLNGTVDGGELQACRCLEWGPSAHCDVARVKTRDVRIADGARLRLAPESVFRDVDIRGDLTADLEATGTVTVRAGGCLRGRIRAARLVVEEGGGLKARLRVG